MPDHSPPCLCPSCGYDLAPQEEIENLTCPECGNHTTRQDATSAVEQRIVTRFYLLAAFWIIGPTLIPNAILLTDYFTAHDLLDTFSLAWVICVPVSLLGTSTAVFIAYRRSPWKFRRRMRARWLVLFYLVAILSAGGWYAIYRVWQVVLG